MYLVTKVSEKVSIKCFTWNNKAISVLNYKRKDGSYTCLYVQNNNIATYIATKWTSVTIGTLVLSTNHCHTDQDSDNACHKETCRDLSRDPLHVQND